MKSLRSNRRSSCHFDGTVLIVYEWSWTILYEMGCGGGYMLVRPTEV